MIAMSLGGWDPMGLEQRQLTLIARRRVVTRKAARANLKPKRRSKAERKRRRK